MNHERASSAMDTPGRAQPELGCSNFLSRQDCADAVYQARAWAQGISWTVVLGGVGSILTGLAQHDTALLCSGVTAVVVAFVPRARPVWVYEVAKTWMMKQGWADVPASEKPLRPADEILAKRVEVRKGDES